MADVSDKVGFTLIGPSLVIALAAATWVAGCSAARVGGEDEHPTITFPTELDSNDAGAKQSTPTGMPKKKPRIGAGFAPDPAPTYSADQWELGLRYNHGRISLASVKAHHFDQPQATARQTGRFMFELWVGRELIERVRFDFPLLADEVPPNPGKRDLHPQPSFGPGADVTRTIMVPKSTRATRAQIVDRATAKAVEISWPPETQPSQSPAPDPAPASK